MVAECLRGQCSRNFLLKEGVDLPVPRAKLRYGRRWGGGGGLLGWEGGGESGTETGCFVQSLGCDIWEHLQIFPTPTAVFSRELAMASLIKSEGCVRLAIPEIRHKWQFKYMQITSKAFI